MNNITPLCEIALKYGTDKCPQLKHSYTPFYYSLWKDNKHQVKKVLELGIGHYKDMDKKSTVYDPGLDRIYHKGASLYMWRDFFPNATIFGADNRPETIFDDNRIKTYLIDERVDKDLHSLINHTGTDLDIVIDDASHRVDDQIFAAKTLLPLLNKSVTYIIEDVNNSSKIAQALPQYEIEVPSIPRKWKSEMLVVIQYKNGAE